MKDLTDAALEDRLAGLVIEERGNLAAILEHLAELDHRGIWSKRDFPSLFRYCTDKLGYSESAAAKRIYAARAAKNSH